MAVAVGGDDDADACDDQADPNISRRCTWTFRVAGRPVSDLASVVVGGPVRIVGPSAGAYFALLYALARPDVVDRVVPVGSIPGFVSGGPFFFRLLATPGIGRVLLGRQPKDAEANLKEISSLVVDPGCLPVDAREGHLLARAPPGVAKSSYDFFRALANPVMGVRSAPC